MITKEPTPEEVAEKLQQFLNVTKEKFDRYFENLGYICFVFNKEHHKGESVYITNSPNDILPVLEPYANAKEIALSRGKKDKLKGFRR